MMKMHVNAAVTMLAVAGIGFASGSAQAAAIVYDSFSFATDGTKLAGNTGDTGLGAWANTNPSLVQTSAPNLSYGSLVTGGSAVQTTTTLWGRPRAAITADMTGLLADGGELWFSLRIAKNAGELARIGFVIGDSAASTNGVLEDESTTSAEQAIGGYLERNSGKIHSLIWQQNTVSTNNFQAASPTETTASTILLAAANSYSAFVVGHAQWGADGSATDTLTFYSPSSSALGTPGAVMAVSQGVVSQQSFDTLSFATGGGIAYYDEIRIGATYADVVPVPEPASLAVLGLGGVLMASRRRR